jgi:hypothetical protein
MVAALMYFDRLMDVRGETDDTSRDYAKTPEMSGNIDCLQTAVKTDLFYCFNV